MDIEWILFLFIILISCCGYILLVKYNNCILLLISNLLFIIYGIVMAIISKD